MPTGYSVTLGDNRLNQGDGAATSAVNFTEDRVIGTGSVVVNTRGGFMGWGNTYTTVTGTYMLGTDGTVYFVPDSPISGTIRSVTAETAPASRLYTGTANADTLTGSTGNDLIYGGTDTSGPGTGNDTIEAGRGNDEVYGGDGSDTIRGGSGDDLIYGGTGDDRLNGNGGNDRLYGGDGADSMFGGIGTDSLYGGAGNDWMRGGSDSDRIETGDGLNTAFGGTGNDTIIGGTGADTLSGNAGADSIQGGDGADLIYGGNSNDVIDAGAGNDTVRGEDGSDSILGGAGDDVLYGDDTAAAPIVTETMRWSLEGAAGTDVRNGFTQDTGEINVSVSFRDDGSLTSALRSGDAIYTGPGSTSTSSVQILGGAGDTSTTVFDFAADPASGVSDEVVNVSFWITDIDAVFDGTNAFRDQITVTAFDAEGNAVPVTLTVVGNDTLNGNTVTAADSNDAPDQAAGASSGAATATSPMWRSMWPGKSPSHAPHGSPQRTASVRIASDRLTRSSRTAGSAAIRSRPR